MNCAGMPKSSLRYWLRSGVDAMRILVADDDADLRALIGFTLMQAGFDICTAVDGESALQAFQQNSPDLVLLDINMPEPNGLRVCREIRGRSPVPSLPPPPRAHAPSSHGDGATTTAGAADERQRPRSPAKGGEGGHRARRAHKGYDDDEDDGDEVEQQQETEQLRAALELMASNE